MPINVNMNQMNAARFGSRAAQKKNTYANWPGMQTGGEEDKSALAEKRRYARGQEDRQDGVYSRSAAEQSTNRYAETLKKNREKAKETKLKLKKLQYSFKSISSQLIRSKTSVDAARVARKAKRELYRLKSQRLSSEYDQYELQSAITHAQAIVRVAKKKVKHLQEEELVKVKGGPCSGEMDELEERWEEIEEKEEEWRDRLVSSGLMNFDLQGDVAEAAQEWEQTYEEMMRVAEFQEELQMRMKEMEETATAMEVVMSDSLKKLLEDSELSELEEEPVVAPGTEMDPEDYKMMKLRHRLKEMKAIAQADAEYLKAVFNKMEKARELAVQSSSGSENQSASAGSTASTGSIVPAGSGSPASVAPAGGIDIVSAPDTVPAAAPVMGGIDISV